MVKQASENNPIKVLIVAVQQTAGSALYGMVDVLMAAGNLWQALVREGRERRFKAATGHTLIDHLHNFRIEEAKNSLETTQNAIAEISVAVGYEDVPFFRQLFRRLTGLTPGEYRCLFEPVLQGDSEDNLI